MIEIAEQPNALVKIVEQSGLEKTKAQFILEKFQDYFKIAADWEQKTKLLVVTSPTQTAEMKMAREGRLFLREKRLDIERARKELKEQSLREGKAIDGIAAILKGLIVPIEEYLDRQERFVEIREDEMKELRKVERVAEMQSLGLDITFYDLKNMPDESYRQLVDTERRAIRMRKEAEEKAEAERIAKEKADAEEREQMHRENERLRRETEEKERQLARERVEAEVREKKIRAEQQVRLEKERAEAEARQRASEQEMRKAKGEAEAREKKLKAEQQAKLEKERAERSRLEAELKAKAESEAKERKLQAEEEKRLERERRTAERAPDKEKLIALVTTLEKFELPAVKSKEARAILVKVRSGLNSIIERINEEVKQL